MQFSYTILSKRKLTYFVDNGYVRKLGLFLGVISDGSFLVGVGRAGDSKSIMCLFIFF